MTPSSPAAAQHGSKSAAVPAAQPAGGGTAGQRFSLVPFVLSLGLLGFLAVPRVHQHPHLFWAFAGTGGLLVAWQILLWIAAARRGRPLLVEAIAPIKQHFVQACVQSCLYVYWGYLWVQDGVRPIYQQAPLILAQFVFLYAFDGLFAWSRGRPWRFTSGPVPIVLSTNLFIWFRDDWFVFQFAMVTAGLLGKEFVKWTRDGRRTHIFNPSGFGLMCAATVLIVTGTTDLTWAKPLATTIEVPGIFLFIFGIGLVVQHFFSVTMMTFAAVLAMVASNLLYTQVTGVYLFGSSNLPAAAFLGLHLLMTDPSTSPRTVAGRTLFGAAYGLGYVVMFEILGAIGAPELYAKLYPVPILNCCVQVLDRWARTGWLSRLNTRWETALPWPRMNAIHMAVWSAVFLVLISTGYLGREHAGDSILFWKQAVAERRHDAQRKLVMVAGSQAIARQSGDAYNELGLLSLQGDIDPASEATRHKSAGNWFAEAAARGSDAAHANIVEHFLFHGARRSDADLDRSLRHLEQALAKGDDARAAYLLGLAHETGGARPLDLGKALELYRRCGDDLFAQKGIARIGLGAGSMVDLGKVAPALTAAAAAGDGEASYYLAYMHQLGRGVPRDAAQAKALLERAATLGFVPAQEARQQAGAGGEPPPFAVPRRKLMTAPPFVSAFPLPPRAS